MARFFRDLEDEKEQIKKKTSDYTSDDTERAQESKKDKRLQELGKMISEAEGSKKNFDKLAKKIFTELKKLTGFFEKEQLPEYLERFLSSDGVRNSKHLQDMAGDFKEKIQKNVVKAAGPSKTANKSKRNTLQDVLEIANEGERATRLEDYCRSESTEDELALCLIALFSIYSKRGDAHMMIETLMRVPEIVNCTGQHAKTIRSNIGVYLGKIANVMDRERHRAAYQELLERLSPVVDVEENLLEFKFNTLSLVEDSRNRFYKLLYYVRLGDWEAAASHFTAAGLQERQADLPHIRIIFEFAHFAAVNGDYRLAFDVFSAYDDLSDHDLVAYRKLQLYGLCVVLAPGAGGTEDDRPKKETDLFNEFLDQVRQLFNNPLCLPSENSSDEVARAFYLLSILDYEGAAGIIKERCGFDCEAILKRKAHSLLA